MPGLTATRTDTSTLVSALCKPYYGVRLLATLAYVSTRLLPSVGDAVYGPWANQRLVHTMNERETTTLYIVVLLIALRYRRRINNLDFVSGILGFLEIANVFLFSRVSLEVSFAYVAFVLSLRFIFPEPAIDGPEHMSIMDQATLMKNIRKSGRDTVLIVYAFASYSKKCQAVSVVLRDLVTKFSNRHLKFVKADVARQPLLEDDLKLDAGHACSNLPIFIAFKGGREIGRYPSAKANKTLTKNELFSFKSIVEGLSLVNLHAETSTVAS